MSATKPTSLTRLFADLNQKWFDGRLRPRPVRWADWSNRRLGLCTSRAIYIRRNLLSDEVLSTLLHEMCHIGDPSHGRKWRGKMERIRHLGAPVSEIDFGPAFNPLRQAANIIDDLASQLRPGAFPPWSKVRRVLAHELYMSQAELARKIPWARKRWQRRVREEREDQARRAQLFIPARASREPEGGFLHLPDGRARAHRSNRGG